MIRGKQLAFAVAGLVLAIGEQRGVSSAYAQQATLQTFTDKAAFLAATGATNATGPLPDLGPVDSAHVGSLLFSPTSVDDTLYIGASGTVASPDWYPPRPGNEMAMSFEDLTVEAAAPIFAFGFEFVEPKTTVQPWGGTPVNSTYKVFLYNGLTEVGQFTFDAPDDVVAFVGVHSSQAFNRAVIFDTSKDPDDEYFGEFYTGTAPAAPRTFTALARSDGAIPGATGVFATFPLGPAVRAGRVGFLGLGSAGQQGVYSCDSASPLDPCRRFADMTTAIPSGSGMFTGFGELALARVSGPSIRAAFLASGAGQQGVYLSEVPPNPTVPPNPVKLADLATPIPSGTGTFSGFSQLAASGSVTGFLGTGAGQAGVYSCDSATPTDPCRRFADMTTAIPSGTGLFTAFNELALAADVTIQGPPPIRVAFLGSGATGQQGVYSCDSATPVDPCRRLADLATAIPDGTGAFTSFNSLSVAVNTAVPDPPPLLVAFLGGGTAGQQGVFLSEVPPNPIVPPNPTKIADLATPIPQGAGTFTGFSAVSAGAGHVAFLGLGSGGQAGIYLASAITKVIAVGDTLEGKSVAALRLGQFGLDGGSLAFAATFTDGTQGVYSASVNAFNFSGFFQPVANLPVWNQVNAGQGVPVKFSLHGNRSLDIFAAGYPKSEPISCDSSALVSGVEQTVTAGSSSLSYDPSTDQYIYVWKTDRAWANTCRQLVVTLKDGISHRANFKFK